MSSRNVSFLLKLGLWLRLFQKKLGFNDINSDKWIFKTFPYIVALKKAFWGINVTLNCRACQKVNKRFIICFSYRLFTPQVAQVRNMRTALLRNFQFAMERMAEKGLFLKTKTKNVLSEVSCFLLSNLGNNRFSPYFDHGVPSFISWAWAYCIRTCAFSNCYVRPFAKASQGTVSNLRVFLLLFAAWLAYNWGAYKSGGLKAAVCGSMPRRG